jgi:hypothetical protein
MLCLTSGEVQDGWGLLACLRRTYTSAENPDFLLDAPVHARALPSRIYDYLNRFRRLETG